MEDDIFSAFEASASGATAAAAGLGVSPSVTAAAAAVAASKKRAREEALALSTTTTLSSISSSQVGPALSPKPQGIDAIDNAKKLDVDPLRNKHVTQAVAKNEEVVRSTLKSKGKKKASLMSIKNEEMDDDEDDDNKEDAIVAASEAAGAARGVSVTLPTSSSSSEIGEAIRPQLTRGEINNSRSTAPDAVFNDSSDGISKTPAKTYPFTLDPFQSRAISCLERDESVLVSAHTSAGKTVVAEYAIAMSLRDKQRVIYTSPIKALSNQKYRDLFEEFSDVGLMTGDVTINPNASCLVMTTEILRSMLYRGSEVMREVKWVIFDEIHYMRDKERGVVWEESIIMLPHKVRFVFLSATIPNAIEFAEWVAKIHHQTCHVVYTDYRPTPLQHFIFPAGGEGVYLVVDEKGNFREDTFSKAMAVLGSTGLDDAIEDVVSRGAGKRSRARTNKGKGGPSDLYKIVKLIMERNYDPVIIFSFSKRECEQYAMQMAKLDFTTSDEKTLIEQVFLNAIDSLSEDDRQLPQIDAILPLLKKGVGIHHGGLLPILKEVIEILFQESLLKALFATETFSMGVNMPARTVVFTASRKWDGTDMRWISPGEYIQMSGRAGRRGLDDRGIVIQMIDEKMEPSAAKDILRGQTDPLHSAFHLGYNMLLNLLRVEGGDPERMMALSFHQFQNERNAPALEAELASAEEELEKHVSEIDDDATNADYFALCTAMDGCRDAMRHIITTPSIALPFLNTGRMVHIIDEDGKDWGWGIIVDFQRFSAAAPVASALGSGLTPKGTKADEKQVVLRILLQCKVLDVKGGSTLSPSAAHPASTIFGPISKSEVASSSRIHDLHVIPVLLPLVASLSAVKMALAKDIVSNADARQTLATKLVEVLRRFPTGPPLLDPVEDMQIEGPEISGILEKTSALTKRMEASPVHLSVDRDVRFASFKRKTELETVCRSLREKLKKCRVLAMRDQLKAMKRVLRRLGLVDAQHVVQMKGRVACEVSTADELLITELIFSGVFNDLDPAQAAATLSCLIYTDKPASSSQDESKPPLREELAGPLRQVQAAAKRIAEVSVDCKIEIDPDEYVDKFNPGMMELVYAWVNGARFVDVCTMTKEFEGSIIRVIRRLEELTRQLGDASKAIGDEALQAKFKEASTKMRRNIVFAASLYL
jgi:ATP-dependent RNA helicase DOB1